MSARVLVIIPTHDHGPTLRYSVASALDQTERDLEVVVIGDGAPVGTREIVAELAAADPRLRYVEHPKGERHGEAYRHDVILESRADVVCHLSDDDLWLPNHVAEVLSLLERADFANTLPLQIDPAGKVMAWPIDLARPDHRALITASEPRTNRVPFGCVGLTVDAYRRLPEGWGPAPKGELTDHWMWTKVLRQSWIRAASGLRPTTILLPSAMRRGVAMERRLEELDRWAALVADPGWCRTTYIQMVLEAVYSGWVLEDSTSRAFAAERAFHGDRITEVEQRNARVERELQEAQASVNRAWEAVPQLQAQLAAEEARCAALADEVETVGAHLAALVAEHEARERTVTWRARGALLRFPGVAALARVRSRGRR